MGSNTYWAGGKRRSAKSVPKPNHGNRKRELKKKLRNGCSGKKRYTYDNAVSAARALLEDKPHLGKVAVYICSKGNHYHVSRKDYGYDNGTVAVVEVE